MKSGWGAEHKGCYIAVRRKFMFLCDMRENPHNSIYVHFLLNKYTVVLFLNKKKKSMPGRQALISSLTMAKQYVSMKEEKGNR